MLVSGSVIYNMSCIPHLVSHSCEVCECMEYVCIMVEAAVCISIIRYYLYYWGACRSSYRFEWPILQLGSYWLLSSIIGLTG